LRLVLASGALGEHDAPVTAEIVGPVFLLVVLVAFVYLTLAGVIRAFRNGDTGWGAGIIGAWLLGMGWLVGAVYLATHKAQGRGGT
jgi:cytochrome c oxidase assembly factor CtaG